MLFTNFNAFNDSSTIYLSYPHFSRYWLTDSSNTFQLKDSGIKTWGQSSNQIHFHDQGDATKYSCDRCRETINYLLEPPVFDDLDAPYPNKYKLFSNFRFASKKTATNRNTFYGPKPVDSNSSPNDFSSNGKIIDEEQEPEAPEKKLNANTSSTPAKGPKNLQESSPVWQKQTVVDENQQFPFYNVLFPTLDMVTAKVVPKYFVYHCVFCKNNNKHPAVYTSHILKDSSGRVCCPILRAYSCPKCGAYGDNAHTIKYCPLA